jgi:hypothetical protein
MLDRATQPKETIAALEELSVFANTGHKQLVQLRPLVVSKAFVLKRLATSDNSDIVLRVLAVLQVTCFEDREACESFADVNLTELLTKSDVAIRIEALQLLVSLSTRVPVKNLRPVICLLEESLESGFQRQAYLCLQVLANQKKLPQTTLGVLVRCLYEPKFF